MIQTGGSETMLSEHDSTQIIDQDQVVDTAPDRFEYSAEVLEIMQEFADIPMVYEREGELLYAEGSYHAVQLCLYLQNDKLPASFFRRNFTAAAARHAEIDAAEEEEEKNKEASADILDGQTDSQDDVSQSDIATEHKQTLKPKPESPIAKTSVDSQIRIDTVQVNNVSSEPRIPTIASKLVPLDSVKNARVSVEKQSNNVVIDAKISKKSTATSLQARTSSSKQSDSEFNVKIKPVLDDSLVDTNKQREVEAVGIVRVPEAEDILVNDEVVLYEKIKPEYKVDDDVAVLIAENTPEEFTPHLLVASESKVEPGIELELEEDVVATAETTFSTYIENINDDEYLQSDDVEEDISNQGATLERSEDVKAMPQTEIIVELNHVLEHFAHSYDEEVQFQQGDQLAETEPMIPKVLNDEHAAALYQCLEAQIRLLTETERATYSLTNKLPRQIKITFETFFEEIGVEDPELAARLYAEKYGVSQLLDIVAPIALSKTTITVALSERYHRMAQFITSLLHDDGKLAQANT